MTSIGNRDQKAYILEQEMYNRGCVYLNTKYMIVIYTSESNEGHPYVCIFEWYINIDVYEQGIGDIYLNG